MPAKSYFLIPALVIGFVLATTVPALALEMEFHTTYGGFDPIHQAFNKIALIASDSGYRGLFFTVATLGIFFAGASAVAGTVSKGLQAAMPTWAVPSLIGLVIFVALFIPTGKLMIYDPTTGAFQEVQLPVGIVAIAGTLNTIERGFVEMIDTAGAPGSYYYQSAGGIGFNVLKEMGNISPANAHARASMSRYIEDCVSFELVRPGTTLSLDVLRNSTTDFMTELAKAQNPMIYTVYFSAANPHGVSMSCVDAWQNIQPIYADPNFWAEAVEGVCARTGLKSGTVPGDDSCNHLIVDTVNLVMGKSITSDAFARQTHLANVLYDFYYTSDYETSIMMQANRQLTTSGIGMGITMNSWVPIMRAVMTAIAVGLIPFLMLFIPTPLVGKALSVMAGFFVFLTTWGITDAIIHGATMDHAVNAFAEIRDSGLGVYAAAAFPEQSTKLLSMFGMVRSSGIMLASFLTMMLIRFGGHALAMMAGSLSGTVQGAGAQSGRQLTPEGKAQSMAEQQRSAGMLKAWSQMDEDKMNGMGRGSFEEMSGAAGWQQHQQAGSHSAAMDHFGATGRGDMSMGQKARSMAGSNVSSGGPGGRHSTTTGPDGRASMTQLDSVDNAFQRQNISGADGIARTTAKGAAGNVTGMEDGAGNWRATDVSVNGLDALKVGRQEQGRFTSEAASSLATEANYGKMLSRAQQDATNDTRAQSFLTSLSNNETESWKRGIGEDSSLRHVRAEESQHSLAGFLKGEAGANWSLGVRASATAGGEAKITATGKDGETVTFNVNEQQMREFQQTQQHVRQEALNDTLTDSRQLAYASNLSQSIGAKEAQSAIDKAQVISTDTTGYGANLTTSAINREADRLHSNSGGSANPENVERVVADWNRRLTHGDAEERQVVFDRLARYANDESLMPTAVGSPAMEAVDAGRARAQGGLDAAKGEIAPVAAEAGARTGGITPDSFNAPEGVGTLNGPNKDRVVGAADRVHEHNQRERAGDGNIQTTIPSMVGGWSTPRSSTPGLPEAPAGPDGQRETGINPDGLTDRNIAVNNATGEYGSLYNQDGQWTGDGTTGGGMVSMAKDDGAAKGSPFAGSGMGTAIDKVADRLGIDTSAGQPVGGQRPGDLMASSRQGMDQPQADRGPDGGSEPQAGGAATATAQTMMASHSAPGAATRPGPPAAAGDSNPDQGRHDQGQPTADQVIGQEQPQAPAQPAGPQPVDQGGPDLMASSRQGMDAPAADPQPFFAGSKGGEKPDVAASFNPAQDEQTRTSKAGAKPDSGGKSTPPKDDY